MICREYLENYSPKYLQGKLYSCEFTLFISAVNSYDLIMRT